MASFATNHAFYDFLDLFVFKRIQHISLTFTASNFARGEKPSPVRLVIVGVVTFFFDMHRKGKQADDLAQLSDEEKMGYFASKSPNFMQYIFRWKLTVPLPIPKIQFIVEIGDDLVYTSSVFDQMKLPCLPSRVSWVEMFSSIFDTAAYRVLRDEIEVDLGPTANMILSKAMSRDLYDGGNTQEPQLINCVRIFEGYRSKYVPKSKYLHKVLEVENLELTDRASPTCEWSYESEFEKLFSYPFVSSYKPCLQVSREELSALALILGMNLCVCESHNPYSLHGEGAFGISASATLSHDMHWQLRFVRTSRRPRHDPSAGSGYSTLFAKYLACGAIPFARGNSENDSKWIKSVYIQDLNKFEEGGYFKDLKDDDCLPDALEYLSRLPTSETTMLWPHLLETQSTNRHKDWGLVKTIDNQTTGTWWDAVAGIPFGGLVPQTTREIKQAVQFTVSELPTVLDITTRCESDSLLNELEMLINESHRQHESLNLFGNHVHERAKSLDTDINFVTKCYDTRDAAAVFGRYMTLLEHLSATCFPGGSANDLESLHGQVSAYLKRSYRTWIASDSKKDTKDVLQKLGIVIKGVRRAYEETRTLSPDQTAKVTCCLIAAWAENVQEINLGLRRRSQDSIANHGRIANGEMINDQGRQLDHTTYMEDLPPIIALS
ncbi:hypothetical protein KXV58_002207 [Aspergillus fumigatus]|nr:hypothetical protein KXV58_002207 [Aspergillus fumigatus]